MGFDAYEQLAVDPGAVGDVARSILETPSQPGEIYSDTQYRSAQQAGATARIQAIKGKQWASRGVPSYQDMQGNTKPVVDDTGSPLNKLDPRHNIAYDSTGSPKKIDFDAAGGSPVLKDPFEGLETTTDPKTGHQYQIAPGLPWRWVGTDAQTAQKAEFARQDADLSKASAALGRKLTLTEHDALLHTKAMKDAHGQLKQLGVDSVDPTTGDPLDYDSLVAGINSHYDDLKKNDTTANAKEYFGMGGYKPEALKAQADLDLQRAAALRAAATGHAHAQTLDGIRQQAEAVRAQRMMIEQTKLDHETALLKQQGIDISQPKQQYGDTPEDSAQNEQIAQSAGVHPATAQAYKQAVAGQKPYSIEGGKPKPIDGKFEEGLTAAAQDGLIAPPAPEVLEAARTADAKFQELVKQAGGNQKLKAFIASGVKSYTALQAGMAASALVAPFDPELAAGGAALGGVGAVVVPMLVHGVAFLTGMFGANKALDALSEKAAEYSDDMASIQAAIKLNPGAAQLGNLAGMGPAAIKSAMNLSKAAGVAAAEATQAGASGAKAAAGYLGKTAGTGAVGGAIFETTIRPGFDWMADQITGALGGEKEGVKSPTFGSVLENAGIGAILSGLHLKIKDIGTEQGVDIFKRGMQALREGKPLDQVLSPSENDAFMSIGEKLAKMKVSGEELIKDPEKFSINVRQVLTGEDRPASDYQKVARDAEIRRTPQQKEIRDKSVFEFQKDGQTDWEAVGKKHGITAAEAKAEYARATQIAGPVQARTTKIEGVEPMKAGLPEPEEQPPASATAKPVTPNPKPAEPGTTNIGEKLGSELDKVDAPPPATPRKFEDWAAKFMPDDFAKMTDATNAGNHGLAEKIGKRLTKAWQDDIAKVEVTPEPPAPAASAPASVAKVSPEIPSDIDRRIAPVMEDFTQRLADADRKIAMAKGQGNSDVIAEAKAVKDAIFEDMKQRLGTDIPEQVPQIVRDRLEGGAHDWEDGKGLREKSQAPKDQGAAPDQRQQLLDERNRLVIQELPKHKEGTNGHARVLARIGELDKQIKAQPQPEILHDGENLLPGKNEPTKLPDSKLNDQSKPEGAKPAGGASEVAKTEEGKPGGEPAGQAGGKPDAETVERRKKIVGTVNTEMRLRHKELKNLGHSPNVHEGKTPPANKSGIALIGNEITVDVEKLDNVLQGISDPKEREDYIRAAIASEEVLHLGFKKVTEDPEMRKRALAIPGNEPEAVKLARELYPDFDNLTPIQQSAEVVRVLMQALEAKEGDPNFDDYQKLKKSITETTWKFIQDLIDRVKKMLGAMTDSTRKFIDLIEARMKGAETEEAAKKPKAEKPATRPERRDLNPDEQRKVDALRAEIKKLNQGRPVADDMAMNDKGASLARLEKQIAEKQGEIDGIYDNARKAEAPEKPKPKSNSVGVSERGQQLYEDENGVRYRIEDGVKISAPVYIVPTRAGVKAQKQTPEGEWRTAEEAAAEKPKSPLPNRDSALPDASPSMKLADWVSTTLAGGQPFTAQQLFNQADAFFGGTQAAGKYTSKDAFDALEVGVNLHIASGIMQSGAVTEDNIFKERHTYNTLMQLLARLPTQGKRTAEQDEYQQFSTPPPFAYAAAWVANLRPTDIMAETSAGTASLAIWGKIAGVKKILMNEFSGRRAALLRSLNIGPVTEENAENINAVWPKDFKPTVAVINPPFSSTAGRVQGERSSMNGAKHLESLLERLPEGGRLVAIVGEGMKMVSGDTGPTDGRRGATGAAFADWWKRIQAKYNVRANIGVSGKNYAKYGTTFDNQIVVIDKSGPTSEAPITGKVESIAELFPLLEKIRNDRPESKPSELDQPAETPAGGPTSGGGAASDTATGSNGPRKRPEGAGGGNVAAPEPTRKPPAGKGDATSGGLEPAPGNAGGKPKGGGSDRPGAPTKSGAGDSGVKAPKFTAEEQASIDAAREAGGDLFNAAAPEAQTFEDRIPPEKIGALLPTIVRLAQNFRTPEKFAVAVTALGPKAPALTQSLWQIAHATGAQGPANPDWNQIYSAMKPKPEEKPENKKPEEKPTDTSDSAEIGDAAQNDAGETEEVFSDYTPQRLSVTGAKPHPTPLVESSSMRAVKPPAVTYKPSIPKKLLESGALSLPQFESVVYAGQAHNEKLPGGERAGYFIGDGTGVGKGREISAIIIDNARQGRKKAIWISEKKGLIKNAQGDFADLDMPDIALQSLNDTKSKVGTVKLKDGVLFSTYSTMIGEFKNSNIPPEFAVGATVRMADKDLPKFGETATVVKAKTIAGVTEMELSNTARVKSTQVTPVTPAPVKTKARIDQIVEWFGPDYDGVIVFDESHNAKNAVTVLGDRGSQEPSSTGLAVVELQRRLPNARIVYASATGATEVYNLAYADRLGIWGPGTAFANKGNFFNKIAAAGLSAMEIVARDLKALGRYIARTLSFGPADRTNPEDKGVEVGILEHQLTPEQTKMYDMIAKRWQDVYANMQSVLESTGGSLNSRARANARGAFFSSQQRFFNQLLTAIQVPTLLADMHKSLDAGDSVIIQLTNTNEATLDRALAKAQDEETPLEELDLTPKDILLQYVDQSFPVQLYETYSDENGNIRSRPVMDSQGKPVLDPVAIAERDRQLMEIRKMPVPENPLEQILNEFGHENVAEVTGRGVRVVRKEVEGVMKTVSESRSESTRQTEAKDFIDDKRKILVFSQAGGTGFSYHSDKRFKNQRRRIHYLLQAGWSADKAIQGLGRAHRSGQRVPPFLKLLRTNIEGHKRFISTIARRLSQLGALTSGERRATTRGLFTEADNLENQYSDGAITGLVKDSFRGNEPALPWNKFTEQMGFDNMLDPSGALKEERIPSVPQFLNRVLILEVEDMNRVFGAFMARMERAIEFAKKTDTYDPGLQTLKVPKGGEINPISEEEVYHHPGVDEPTKIVEIEMVSPAYFAEFDEAMRSAEMNGKDDGKLVYSKNRRSGRVAVFKEAKEQTDRTTGAMTKSWYRFGPKSTLDRTSDNEVDFTPPMPEAKVGDTFTVDGGRNQGSFEIVSLPSKEDPYARVMVKKQGSERAQDMTSAVFDGGVTMYHATVKNDLTNLATWAKVQVSGVTPEKDVPKPGNFEEITKEDARAIWQKEIDDAEKFDRKRIHFITGLMLPIWDRTGIFAPQVFRVTAGKKTFLGVRIPEKQVQSVRAKLGASANAVEPAAAFKSVLEDGASYRLANDWRIDRRRVSGQYRIEISGLGWNDGENFKNYIGGFSERIGYDTRYFIPTDEANGVEAMTKLLKQSPIVNSGETLSAAAPERGPKDEQVPPDIQAVREKLYAEQQKRAGRSFTPNAPSVRYPTEAELRPTSETSKMGELQRKKVENLKAGDVVNYADAERTVSSVRKQENGASYWVDFTDGNSVKFSHGIELPIRKTGTLRDEARKGIRETQGSKVAPETGTLSGEADAGAIQEDELFTGSEGLDEKQREASRLKRDQNEHTTSTDRINAPDPVSGQEGDDQGHGSASQQTIHLARRLVANKSAAWQRLGIKTRSRSSSEVGGSTWLDVASLDVVSDPDEIARRAQVVADEGGDASKHIRAVLNEEETHWRDVIAGIDSNRSYTELHERIVDQSPTELVRQMQDHYGDTETKAHLGSEILRALSQFKSGEQITEETYPWRDSSELRHQFTRWNPPQWVSDHLQRMVDVTPEMAERAIARWLGGAEKGRLSTTGDSILSAAAPERRATDAVAAGAKGREETKEDRKAAQAATFATKPPGVASQIWDAIKTAGSATKRWWGEMPAYDTIDKAIGQWLGAGDSAPLKGTDIVIPGRQKAAHESRKLVETIVKQFPNVLTRQAISRYMEADGDKTTLQKWADKSKPEMKTVYERALNLNAAEKAMADTAKTFFKEKGEEAQKLGLLGNLLENYVTHFVEKAPANQRSGLMARILGDLASDTPASKLKTKFDHAIKRVFASMFDLEQEGHSLRGGGDIAGTLGAYAQAANNTVADRVFVKSLTDIMARDGRPMAVPSGAITRTDGSADSPLLIKPHTHPADTSDYRPISHPALRKWKWIGKEGEKDVLVEGELLIHPDLYKRLKNTLGTSALNNVPIIKAVGEFQGIVKQFMLSFSPFHFVQEGTHAIGHKINPLKVTEIDMDDPATRELVNAGLMLANWNAKAEFGEGLTANGMEKLLSHIGLGKLGKLNDTMSAFLFEKYIPGLKIAMAKAAMARNMERFKKELASGKMTREQVAQKTAQQANDAFGEQNNLYAGNNPTRLHVERLLFLAPDFLKSRAKFFADAFRKHGREQRNALILLAVVLAVTAKLIERMLTGKNDWKKPFSVVTEDREYELRSVPGDVIAMLKNTRQFVMGRISPLISRTALEAATGRDWRGQQRSAGQQVKDLAMSPLPLALRGAIDPEAPDISVKESLISSSGLRTRRRSEITDARQLGREWQKANGSEHVDEVHPPSKYVGMKNALEDGDDARAMKEYGKLLATMPKEKADTGFRSSLMKPFSGSLANEKAFVASLDADERATYQAAMTKRGRMLAAFTRMSATTLAPANAPRAAAKSAPTGSRALTAKEFFR